MRQTKTNTGKSGFTIVELLIVITIIGILAAITIVAFNGMRERANATSLTSDLSNNSKRLELYRVTNGSYPSTNDCSNGPDPEPPAICIQTSNGNSVTGYSADNTLNPPTFNLTMQNGALTYAVTNTTTPTKVTIASISASGGTKTTSGGDTIYTFTGNGTFTVSGGTIANASILVVGGGGGGGLIKSGLGGGGGGGGQFLALNGITLSGATTVTIGQGGGIGLNGGDSSFGSHTAIGGGGGGNEAGTAGKSGASGGGGGGSMTAGGAGLAGNPGGNGGAPGMPCDGESGGGGGAGGAGSTGQSCIGGPGGIGMSSTISGTTQWYAGGGAAENNSPAGGGGRGGQPGTPNTGGGGGGNGIGGSGIVIIRYATP